MRKASNSESDTLHERAAPFTCRVLDSREGVSWTKADTQREFAGSGDTGFSTSTALLLANNEGRILKETTVQKPDR